MSTSESAATPTEGPTPLAGMTFVLTGSLPGISREDAEEIVLHLLAAVINANQLTVVGIGVIDYRTILVGYLHLVAPECLDLTAAVVVLPRGREDGDAVECLAGIRDRRSRYR